MSDKMRTKVLEFGWGESQVGLNCPEADDSNLPNGRVFGLAGLSQTSSVDPITEQSLGTLGQKNAKEPAFFNKLQIRHLDANNPVTGAMETKSGWPSTGHWEASITQPVRAARSGGWRSICC
jgi:hypothetical protein